MSCVQSILAFSALIILECKSQNTTDPTLEPTTNPSMEPTLSSSSVDVYCGNTYSGQYIGDPVRFKFYQQDSTLNRVEFSACNSTFDTTLLYLGDNLINQIYCDDNCGCLGTSQSALTVHDLIGDKQYYFDLDAFEPSTTSGTWRVSINCTVSEPTSSFSETFDLSSYSSKDVDFTIPVRSNINTGSASRFQVDFNFINGVCNGPTLTFDVEENDLASSYEHIRVFFYGNLIEECGGSGASDGSCGQWHRCINGYSLSTASSQKLTVYLVVSEDINANFCEDLIAANVSISCTLSTQSPTIPTTMPTRIPTNNPTSSSPTIPTTMPTPTPTSNPVSLREYSVSVELYTQGGSQNFIYLVIIGDAGETGIISLGILPEGGLTYTYKLYEGDVGTVASAKMINYNDDVLQVTKICVGSKCAEEYLGDALSYSGSSSSGCALLIADLIDDIMTENDYDYCPYTYTPSPLEIGADREYFISVEVKTQGGSQNLIHLVIEGEAGNETEPILLGVIPVGGETYYFTKTASNVGIVNKGYLINYQHDALCVEAVCIDGICVEELTCDLLSHDSGSLTGCAVLTVELKNDLMTEEDNLNCPWIATPSPIAIGGDRNYSISVEVQLFGGSTDSIYIVIEGEYGETELIKLGSMSTGGETYYFTKTAENIGYLNKTYLINYGDDALYVEGVCVDGICVEELTGDLLSYDSGSLTGCAVLNVQLRNDIMTEEDKSICPWTAPIEGNAFYYIEVIAATGSSNTIYIVIEGTTGIRTSILSLGYILYDGYSESFVIYGLNVGIIAYAHLINYGSDELCVSSVCVNGDCESEFLCDDLAYSGYSYSGGCGVLTVDFINADFDEKDYDNCDNWYDPDTTADYAKSKNPILSSFYSLFCIIIIMFL